MRSFQAAKWEYGTYRDGGTEKGWLAVEKEGENVEKGGTA
nr:hypothetical protein [Tanacetum cinerariifolium]